MAETYVFAVNFPNTSKPDEFGVSSRQPISATKRYSIIDFAGAHYSTDRWVL